MTLLIYLIKTVLISGVLFAYYWLFLRNRFFHQFNRFFLLSIPALSLILPAFHFNLPAVWNRSPSGSPIRLLGVGTGSLEEAITVYAGHRTDILISSQVAVISFCIIISGVLLIRFIRSVCFLKKLSRHEPALKLPEANLYIVSVKGTPFSFFNNIYWGEEMDINSPAGRQILRHEIYHVKNHHSLDIMAIEMISVVCWFNPFIYLIRKEIQAIHEYAADAYASLDSDKYAYASLLLLNVSGKSGSFAHPFFKNQIKRRITMITKTSQTRKGLSGRFMILPLIAGLICLFSFKFQNRFPFHSAKTIRVVIDAGHGGSFTGAVSDGLIEKNINLIIAKKIQALSKDYNVDVIMSRETDMTPGGTDLRQSLEYITALPKNKNADLFISIHTNATDNAEQGKHQTEKSGFQIYIPRNSSDVYENSVKFGSIMTDVIKPDYAIESELKQPENGNVYILRNATVPALLIECGYIDNPNDMKFLQDEKNQDKIAGDILEGIRKYGLNATSFQSISSAIPIDSVSPLTKVEIEASYPGGSDSWKGYILKTLTYPEKAIKKEIQGEVIVEFVVRKDGTLTDVKAISGPEELRSESIRVIAKSGKWVPAVDHGTQVESYKKQPIRYQLSVK